MFSDGLSDQETVDVPPVVLTVARRAKSIAVASLALSLSPCPGQGEDDSEDFVTLNVRNDISLISSSGTQSR